MKTLKVENVGGTSAILPLLNLNVVAKILKQI